MKLLIFFGVPLLVEAVGVVLMIVFIVDVLKCIQAWFILLCFQTERIYLEVSLTTPSKVAVVFEFMQTVTFDTP